MDSLITQASSKVGLEEQTVKKAIAVVLNFFKSKQAKGEISIDVDSILSTLFGGQEQAETWMKEASPTTTTKDGSTTAEQPSSMPTSFFGLFMMILKMFGVLAFLKQLLSTFSPQAARLVDGIDDFSKIESMLSGLGVSHEQGIKVVKMLVDFMQEKLPPDTLEKLMSSVPALQTFFEQGQDKKDD